MCTPCPECPQTPKRVLDSLVLELKLIIIHHEGAGNWTWLLWKSNQCSVCWAVLVAPNNSCFLYHNSSDILYWEFFHQGSGGAEAWGGSRQISGNSRIAKDIQRKQKQQQKQKKVFQLWRLDLLQEPRFLATMPPHALHLTLSQSSRASQLQTEKTVYAQKELFLKQPGNQKPKTNNKTQSPLNLDRFLEEDSVASAFL